MRRHLLALHQEGEVRALAALQELGKVLAQPGLRNLHDRERLLWLRPAEGPPGHHHQLDLVLDLDGVVQQEARVRVLQHASFDELPVPVAVSGVWVLPRTADLDRALLPPPPLGDVPAPVRLVHQGEVVEGPHDVALARVHHAHGPRGLPDQRHEERSVLNFVLPPDRKVANLREIRWEANTARAEAGRVDHPVALGAVLGDHAGQKGALVRAVGGTASRCVGVVLPTCCVVSGIVVGVAGGSPGWGVSRLRTLRLHPRLRPQSLPGLLLGHWSVPRSHGAGKLPHGLPHGLGPAVVAKVAEQVGMGMVGCLRAALLPVGVKQQNPLVPPNSEPVARDGLPVPDALQQAVSNYGVLVLTDYSRSEGLGHVRYFRVLRVRVVVHHGLHGAAQPLLLSSPRT
mmetsp:Transcript_2308/g.7763  ORF Transcript_2308/g.7763 Transcript_2308/m.7763 type:complete len:400 (+) Transcript_2308:707-1906(+)